MLMTIEMIDSQVCACRERGRCGRARLAVSYDDDDDDDDDDLLFLLLFLPAASPSSIVKPNMVVCFASFLIFVLKNTP